MQKNCVCLATDSVAQISSWAYSVWVLEFVWRADTHRSSDTSFTLVVSLVSSYFVSSLDVMPFNFYCCCWCYCLWWWYVDLIFTIIYENFNAAYSLLFQRWFWIIISRSFKLCSGKNDLEWYFNLKGTNFQNKVKLYKKLLF